MRRQTNIGRKEEREIVKKYETGEDMIWKKKKKKIRKHRDKFRDKMIRKIELPNR